MTKFVDAYSTATGRKQRVPAHYFDNPKLSKGLRKTPLQSQSDDRSPEPDDSWTVAQLKEHATTAGIDLANASLKADILAAIQAAPQPSEPTPGSDETPATGADEGAQ